ncbi:hypothetical protein GCM10027346_19340 [Hymenobacter seoulensis]
MDVFNIIINDLLGFFNWQSIFTSAIVTSVIAALYKSNVDRKLVELKEKLSAQNKKIEIEFSSIKNKEKYDYEKIVDSVKLIWTHLTVIEDYFILDFGKEFFANMSNNDSSYSKVRQEVHKIRTEMLFLPDSIHNPIENLLMKIFNDYIQNFHNSVALYIQDHPELQGKEISDVNNAQAMQDINGYLSKMQTDFWLDRDKLRKIIRDKLFKEIDNNHN